MRHIDETARGSCKSTVVQLKYGVLTGGRVRLITSASSWLPATVIATPWGFADRANGSFVAGGCRLRRGGSPRALGVDKQRIMLSCKVIHHAVSANLLYGF